MEKDSSVLSLLPTHWRAHLGIYSCIQGDKQIKKKGWISLFLNRSADNGGPESISVDYELSVLGAEGSALFSRELKYTFKKVEGYGFHMLLKIDEVLSSRREDCLPQGTLSVRCKIWKGRGEVQPQALISSRTRIGIEQISFLHFTENFSTLEPKHKETKQIKFPSKNGLASSCSLCLPNDFTADGKIMVEITPSEPKYILSVLKLSIIDRSGKKLECVEIDNCLDATRDDPSLLHHYLSRKLILDRKSEYLPSGTLCVSCECTFSSGKVNYAEIENTIYGKHFKDTKYESNCNNTDDIYAEQFSTCPSLVDNLKAIYKDQFLTDVELKTKTKSFPAHKNVLCSRSSVFKMMLTNDMKEKITNCIEIDDLEDTTIQQFLLFLYSDALENLEWESAIKLYYAGDKYSVDKLKLVCSSFLVKKLSASNASEVLLLADKHSDSYLKKAVQDFILSHEEAVYSSEEWMNLMKTNPALVSETMCLKYMRK